MIDLLEPYIGAQVPTQKEDRIPNWESLLQNFENYYSCLIFTMYVDAYLGMCSLW